MNPSLSTTDRWLAAFGQGLNTLLARPAPRRASPAGARATDELGPEQRRLSGALMRVNHVGEVCAQALYQSQALMSRSPSLRHEFEQAAQEEVDHLAWTRQRLAELGDRPSLLNPLWWSGAFAIGTLAGLAGDRVSLGFLVETERQVEAHLASHLDRLPEQDLASREIVAQMKMDEAAHAAQAQAAGAMDLPAPVKGLMRLASGLMTRVAHKI